MASRQQEIPNDHEQPKAMGRSPDRRRSDRYPIVGAVSFEWEAPGGESHKASGTTRNIGKDGVFIECASPPPFASLLKLAVTLPTHSWTYGPICLRGNGDVRHSHRETLQTSGFGACVKFQLELPMSIGQPHKQIELAVVCKPLTGLNSEGKTPVRVDSGFATRD